MQLARRAKGQSRLLMSSAIGRSPARSAIAALFPKLIFQQAGRATSPGRETGYGCSHWEPTFDPVAHDRGAVDSLVSHPQQQQEQEDNGGVDRDR